MTWFQGSLLSLLSAKVPSAKSPLRVLYNQLAETAARSHLLIHLLIHSQSKCWLKTHYNGHPGFCLPPLTNIHSLSLSLSLYLSLSLRVPIQSWEWLSLSLNPWALGGADPTPASSGGGHLIHDGQSEHCICLAIGIGSEMSMLPREGQSEAFGLNSRLVELLEKWPFFPFY